MTTSAWKIEQQKALKNAGFNRVKISENQTESAYNLAKRKAGKTRAAEIESEEKTKLVKLFTESDLAELAAQMEGVTRLHVNQEEYKRILSNGAENTKY